MNKYTLIIGLLIGLLAYSFTTKQVKVDYKVIVSNSAHDIKKYIDMYAKYGYTVHSLTPQAITSNDWYRNGNLILVLER